MCTRSYSTGTVLQKCTQDFLIIIRTYGIGTGTSTRYGTGGDVWCQKITLEYGTVPYEIMKKWKYVLHLLSFVYVRTLAIKSYFYLRNSCLRAYLVLFPWCHSVPYRDDDQPKKEQFFSDLANILCPMPPSTVTPSLWLH